MGGDSSYSSFCFIFLPVNTLHSIACFAWHFFFLSKILGLNKQSLLLLLFLHDVLFTVPKKNEHLRCFHPISYTAWLFHVHFFYVAYSFPLFISTRYKRRPFTYLLANQIFYTAWRFHFKSPLRIIIVN